MITLKLCWDHVGIVLGPFWDCFVIIQVVGEAVNQALNQEAKQRVQAANSIQWWGGGDHQESEANPLKLKPLIE